MDGGRNARFEMEAQPKASRAEERMLSAVAICDGNSAPNFREMVEGGGQESGCMSTRPDRNQVEDEAQEIEVDDSDIDQSLD